MDKSVKLFQRFVLIIFVFGFSACKKQALPNAEPLTQGVIRVGEVGSMTGADATFGISTHRGIELAFAEVNAAGGVHGKKLEIISQDDQGKPSDAVLAITKLIQQYHVSAVIGEVASSLSIAMAPIAQQFKVPMISPSSINAKLTAQGDYIFRVCFVDQFQSKVMADFAIQHLKAKTVALLRDTKSDYSRDSAKIFTDYFTRAGGKIVMDQSYSGGDIDFKSQLTAIRAAQPDVILVPGYYTEVGLISRQKRELGISAPLLGGDGWDSPKLKEIGGADLDGSYFVGHFSTEARSEKVQNFISKYRSTFGGATPDGMAALAYDAALILADALKRAPSQTGKDLRDSIAKTQNFEGVTGLITMGSDRNALKSAYVFKLAEGGNAKALIQMNP